MEDFVYLFPPLLEALLAIIIALFVFNRKELWRPFSKIKKKSWLLLFLVLLAGFSARMLVVPHAHQIYYDGFAHINLAQNISNSNVFCVCQKGTDTACESCNARWWPAGYQTILGIVFSVFGGSEGTAFNTNAVIGSLSIVLVFLLAFMVFKSEKAALWASLLFAFIPAHLNLSGSVGMEITSLFFVLLSLVLLEICIRSKKFSVFVLFLAVFSYAVQTRPENFVLVFFIPVFVWLRAGKQVKRFYSIKHLAAIAVFLLSLAVLVQVLDFRITDAPGTKWNVKTAPQLSYVLEHLAPNILFFLWPKYNSIVFIALAFVGGAFLLK
ncbi:MAG: glycosyltransferase family 39 protein, partial [Candidatus Diapherotrites archaeon]